MDANLKQSICIYSSCVIISSLFELYRSQSLLQFIIPFVLLFSIFHNRCFIIDIAGQGPTFTITYTKLYVLVVTLSTQDNTKLLEQLKSSFERTINWNKYEPKVTVQQQNRYLDFLINPSFQGVNRLFVLPFESDRTSYGRYYLLLVEVKNYNVVIDGQNFFDQPVKNSLITYDNIGKIANWSGR